MTTSSNGSNSVKKVDVLDEHLALITIAIGTFGGYRRATRDAIAKLGGSLPDSTAITEGSIKVFPNAPLAKGHTIRRGLFRDMTKRGIKALGSSNTFAIPRIELDAALKEIGDAEVDFKAFVADLDANYDGIFEAYATEQGKTNSAAEKLIREKKFARTEAIGKLTFRSSPFRIQTVVRDGDDAEDGVNGIVQGLGRQLFEEVAAEMEKLLENDAFTKKNRAGQKTLRPLQAVVKKMTGLMFLDERNVKGAVQLVNDTLNLLPRQGYIEDTGIDQPFSTLRRLVETLADADDLVNAAGKICNGMSANDVLFPPAPVVQAQVVQQAAPQATVAVSLPPKGSDTAALPVAVLPSVPGGLPLLPMVAIGTVPPKAATGRPAAMF